jgi:hypothetical protein
MSYDAWKTRSDWDEEARFYSGPSKEQIEAAIASREKDIGGSRPPGISRAF